MSLLDLPPELFTLVISYCLPVNFHGQVITYSDEHFSELRLVCREFDTEWSRLFVSGVIAGNKYVPQQISDEWPLGSVIWFVKTVVSIEYGKTAGDPESSGNDALRYIFKLTKATCGVLQDLGANDKTEEGLFQQSLCLICKGLVLNHEFLDVLRSLHLDFFILPRENKDPVHEEIPSDPTPADILPLLALHGDLDIFRTFLAKEKNLDINKRNPLIGSALYNAAAVHAAAIVNFLLSHGANPHQTGGRFYSPLHASVAYTNTAEDEDEDDGGTDSMSLLLNAGADLNLRSGNHINANRTPIMTAAVSGNRAAVSLLLCRTTVDISSTDWNEETLLHHICRAGDAVSLEKLIKSYRPVDFNYKGEFGTALHAAMNREYYQFTTGHDRVVEVLLERGLSPFEVCIGAETDIYGWARDIQYEAEMAGVEVPGAVERVLRVGREYER